MQTEAIAKRQRRIENLVKSSTLPQPLKMLAGFDFVFQPNLDRKLIMDLATLKFFERSDSILFIGDKGTGKFHLPQSLSLMACQGRCKTFYTTCSELINDLNAGVYEKTLDKRIRNFINPELLLIDEMGHDRLYPNKIKSKPFCKMLNSQPFLTEKVWIIY